VRRLAFRALPYVVYVVGAVVVLHKLWADPGEVMLRDNYPDQVQFEWFLTNGANALAHGENPLFTARLNAPYGVNLMANTSMLALALPFAPVTLIFGADVTFVVVDTVALAGTASAWFCVLDRMLNHRAAATIGGAFCGFAPAMISHANGHPNLAAQFVLPFIVLVVLRLGRPGGRHVRRGLVLAGLVVMQAFINEELLLFTALALGVFLAAYAVSRPREAAARVSGALRSLATTALAAGAALAFPLYHQFFGPGAYHGLPDDVVRYGADLASYGAFATRSLGGDLRIVGSLAQNPTEENSFFGFPLLLALAVLVVWLRRDPVVRALAVTGLVFAVLSLGSRPRLAGADLRVPMPWGAFDGLPLFDSVVPTRFALVVTPVVGCLLAITVLRYDRLGPDETTGKQPASTGARVAGLLVLALMLGPLVPTPLATSGRPAVPEFFTAGTYRDHLPRDAVVLAVPPGWQSALHAMQWQTATGLDFAIFGGYFLAPAPRTSDRTAIYGPVYPPTLSLLFDVAEQGASIGVTATLRARAAVDFRELGLTTIVLPADHPAAAGLRTVVDELVGPGRLVADMWIWDVGAG
jgi:hypothetical protein